MNTKMDMTNGPFLKKIIIFVIPLALSSILQLLFNAADVIVVGQFVGSTSLAAVGSTTSLINLIVNLFVGISVGGSVVLGRYIGKNNDKACAKTVKTSMITSLIFGIALVIIGEALARPMLELMSTPDDVIDLSTLYLRIYFLGMPGFMIYNFGAACLRAIGDTKRPLYYLTIAGVINVIFNLVFVIIFHLDVAGVAIATIMSQYVSALLILWMLNKQEGFLHFNFKEIEFHKDIFFEIIKIGLPAGIQSVIFNISNVLIQSSVNSFGSTVMAGNTAASNIEGFVYVAMNSVYQACLSFTSANVGANKYDNVRKVLRTCLLTVTVVGLVTGLGGYLAGPYLLRIYNRDPDVIKYGLNRLGLVCAPYFLCGLMDTMVGALRGNGYSITPMIVSLTGACLFRIIWILTIFNTYHTQFSLYISYPISWTLTFIAHLITYFIIQRKFPKNTKGTIS